MWRKEFLVTINKVESWCIHAIIAEEGIAKWKRCFVYASCEDEIRKNQWKILLRCNPGDDSGWCLPRDFNDILDSGEKDGGNMRSEASMSTFRDFVRDGVAAVNHLDMIGAHHRPVLLDTEASTKKVKRRFVFYKRWVSEEGCEEIVRRA
ncbi:hypothetical protein LIER_41822 [Lithospermum erythrorhizon]|uniref:Uncharacterized protein n=1 Tax=Lithospermum erythrorhizon TaxID=34254 RepID=A0AAV3RGM3_LITER